MLLARAISIVNNTILLKGDRPTAISVGRGARDVTIANNQVFAPNYADLWPSENKFQVSVGGDLNRTTASTYDDTSIRRWGCNTFAMPRRFKGGSPKADDTVANFMGPVTAAEFNRLTSPFRNGSSDDRFINLPFHNVTFGHAFDAEFNLFIANQDVACESVPHVTTDFTGSSRGAGTVSQGAVER